MGRYSNLVLIQSGKIIDALKRVDFEDSDDPPAAARTAVYHCRPNPISRISAGNQRRRHGGRCLRKRPAGGFCLGQSGWRCRPRCLRGRLCGVPLAAKRPCWPVTWTEAQKQALCAAIENLKDEHVAGGTPTAVRIPQPDGVNKPVEYQLFYPAAVRRVRPF